MVAEPKVVVVSVGESPTALLTELGQRGLLVSECQIADAEEEIERVEADLVVLHGSRGAMELTTLLDDPERKQRPRLAIVAGGRELSRLWGLNREIVVSLLASEMSVRVIAERLQGLAKQWARAKLDPQARLSRMPIAGGTGFTPPPFPAVGAVPAPEVPVPEPMAPVPPAAEAAPARREAPASAPIGKLELKKAIKSPLEIASGEKAPDSKKEGNLASLLSLGPMFDRAAESEPEAKAAPTPVAPAVTTKQDDIPTASPPAVEKITAVAERAVADKTPSSERAEKKAEPAPASKERPPSMLIDDLEAFLASEPPPPGDSAEPVPPPPPARTPARQAAPASDDSISIVEDLELISDSIAPPSGAEATTPPTDPSPTALANVAPSAAAPPATAAPAAAPSPAVATPAAQPPRRAFAATLLGVPLGPEGLGAGSPAAAPKPPAKSIAAPLPATPAAASAGSASAAADSDPSTAPVSSSKPLELTKHSEPPHGSGGSPLDKEGPSAGAASPFDAPVMSAPIDTARSADGSPVAPVVADAPPAHEDESTRPSQHDPFAATTLEAVPHPFREPVAPPPAAVATDSALPRLAPTPVNPTAGGSKKLVGITLAALLGGGALIAWGATRQSSSSAGTTKPAATRASATSAPTQPAPSQAAPTQPAPTGEPGAVPSDAVPAGDAPAGDAVVEPAAGDAPSQAPASTTDGRSPFAVDDQKLAGCEELAQGVTARTADAPAEASVAWAEARRFIMKGDLAKANVEMCKAVALHEQSAAIEGLALLYATRQSPAQALTWVQRAEAVRPGQLETATLLGVVQSQLGNTDEALRVWLTSLRIAETDTVRRQMVAKEDTVVGRQYLRQGDVPRAERLLRRAAILDPKNASALTAMSEVCLKQGRAGCAAAFAEQALAVFEANPEAHVLRGDAAALAGDKARAKASYERALAVRPDFWAATLKLRGLE